MNKNNLNLENTGVININLITFILSLLRIWLYIEKKKNIYS